MSRSTDRQPRRGVPFGRAARERCVASGRAAPARSLALRRVAAASAALLAGATGFAAVGLAAAAPADAATPGSWSATGAMPVGLADATATLLGDGDVLVAGGQSAASGSPSSTAELYDPANGSWSLTGAMPVAMTGATATLLPGGEVLLAGGMTASGTSLVPTGLAELYNPSTNAWSQTGSLPSGLAVSGASATLLPGGEVLVAGGMTGTGTSASTTADAELYDPSTGTWSATGSLPLGVEDAVMTAFTANGGGVLLAGGITKSSNGAATVSGSSEVYEAPSGTFRAVATLPVAVADASSVLLDGGRVLVAGGETSPSGTPTNAAERFDPATDSWSQAGALPTAVDGAAAAVLGGGDVLLAGGATGGSGGVTGASALFDPSTGSWSATGSLLVARSSAVAARLGSGDVLVAGGAISSSAVTSDAELYTASLATAFTSPSTLTLQVGTNASFTVTTTGSPAATLAESGALPRGVIFTASPNGAATISGTPQVGTAGTYHVTITANGGPGAPVTQVLTVTVAGPRQAAPAITSPSILHLRTGTYSRFTISSTGVPVPRIGLRGRLPAGMRFAARDDGTATIYGTAARSATGAYLLAVDASNGVGSVARQTLRIDVAPGPQILFTSRARIVVRVRQRIRFAIHAEASPTPRVSATGRLPLGLRLVALGGGTDLLVGAPYEASAGQYALHLVATNGVAPAVRQVLHITVTRPLPPALHVARVVRTRVGAYTKIRVLATGSPVPVTTLAGRLPAGLRFVTRHLSPVAFVAGSPAQGSAGSYLVVFTATNGVGRGMRVAVRIEVLPVAREHAAHPGNGQARHGPHGRGLPDR
ncbi:MAG: kelch repeat-containing protein [Acidimicrobiales bacterium]